jgi:hypothetical protein
MPTSDAVTLPPKCVWDDPRAVLDHLYRGRPGLVRCPHVQLQMILCPSGPAERPGAADRQQQNCSQS